MSTTTHIISLQEKCDNLKLAIKDALRSPSTDDLNVIRLKKTKLRLKDEIAQLQRHAC